MSYLKPVLIYCRIFIGEPIFWYMQGLLRHIPSSASEHSQSMRGTLCHALSEFFGTLGKIICGGFQSTRGAMQRGARTLYDRGGGRF